MPHIICPKCNRPTDMYTLNDTYMCNQCHKDYHICRDGSDHIAEGYFLDCKLCNRLPPQPKNDQDMDQEYQKYLNRGKRSSPIAPTTTKK